MTDAQPQTYSVLAGQSIPDGALVVNAQAGDQRAFESLVNRYQRSLASYIRIFLKDGDQAADVLQQVYLQLYLSLPALLTNVSLEGWLFRVARSRCLDELRRRRRRAETPFSTLSGDGGEEDPSPLEIIPDPDPLPEEVVEQVDLAHSLQEAIACLPPGQRPVVQLRCFKQLTFAEIGRLLNMREMAVKTSFYRALPRLRRALTGNGYLAAVS